MCGRYYIANDDMDEMQTAFVAEARSRAERMGVSLHSSGDIRPTDIVPVIATSANRRQIGAYPMRWGFQHPTRGMLVFNTRSETAPEKALFCTSIIDRRCLIPVSGYYEWQKVDGKKIRFQFSSSIKEPLYLAGLYLRSSHASLPVCTILTRAAAADIQAIHARMPVILAKDHIQDWLSSEKDYREFLDAPVPDLRYDAN